MSRTCTCLFADGRIAGWIVSRCPLHGTTAKYPPDPDPLPVWSDDAAIARAADAISDVGRRYANADPEDEGEYLHEAAYAALRAALEGR